MDILQIRKNYHQRVSENIIRIKQKDGEELPNFADISNKSSVRIALQIIDLLGFPKVYGSIQEQTVGGNFETFTRNFIEESFGMIQHLRPGSWTYSTHDTAISNFDQYKHLAYIEEAIKANKELSSTLGRDYIVKPDIIISRLPVEDAEINRNEMIIDSERSIANLTPIRRANEDRNVCPILHASISCKWTIRSDRSQNTRTEALNLIRNRKGNLPHVVAVTAEPLPTRLAALALGTGDLDCVYHFALKELIQALDLTNNEDQKDMLSMMVDGRRLRDISDLPFDLAI